jgi:hypothetical protein
MIPLRVLASIFLLTSAPIRWWSPLAADSTHAFFYFCNCVELAEGPDQHGMVRTRDYLRLYVAEGEYVARVAELGDPDGYFSFASCYAALKEEPACRR